MSLGSILSGYWSAFQAHLFPSGERNMLRSDPEIDGMVDRLESTPRGDATSIIMILDALEKRFISISCVIQEDTVEISSYSKFVITGDAVIVIARKAGGAPASRQSGRHLVAAAWTIPSASTK